MKVLKCTFHLAHHTSSHSLAPAFSSPLPLSNPLSRYKSLDQRETTDQVPPTGILSQDTRMLQISSWTLPMKKLQAITENVMMKETLAATIALDPSDPCGIKHKSSSKTSQASLIPSTCCLPRKLLKTAQVDAFSVTWGAPQTPSRTVVFGPSSLAGAYFAPYMTNRDLSRANLSSSQHPRTRSPSVYCFVMDPSAQ
ncbi:hypothetical protein IV203_026007 [Nitzschia inconspicua]|uniref:Uncharacterized protein n=1 Tax=Nitzschia inconspicua TaxID=303405 RepID=A0A9K3P9F1_9STRA|nr:hypothetical protein IV203_026007 [Nitzschia inconspicua]